MSRTQRALLALSCLIGETLDRILDDDVRFALVVWRADGLEPLFSTSNESKMEIPRAMLHRSAEMINESEIFADYETVGNA